jgi:conjugal transfer mating pair stabilization protein TraG
MDFNIYVLGDVRLFADTINGIAMMFQVASGERIDLWASNTNSMGLGMGAFLGMLLAICMLVYNAAFKQRFDLRAIILPLILYICLTMPKVQVNIIDGYYRDGVQSVSGVPLGLALPMSAISSIAFSATEKIETVFQVPNNGSFTKITEDGFVMPLKLLHSLRYTGLTMRDAYPNVTESLAEVVKICLTNNDSFDELEYQSSPRSMSVFFSALNDPIAGSRLVKIFPTSEPTGRVVNCSRAATYIQNSLSAYIDGVAPNESLISTDDVKVKNLRSDIEKILASNNGNTGSRNLTNISSMRILDDIQAMTNVSNDDALNFVAATIFNPQLSTATECVVSSDNRATARCFSYATAAEQWKEKSAAEASGFLSIMRDGQNLLILLSVTLFPIMVLIIVLQGIGGLKVVMSYLLYTISAYMWIPVASMINYYTQVQLDDELKKWASRIPQGTDIAASYLSLANAPLFYDAISKKLALANSVMASVPMICMGLFSGMLMTMNRLADKMNPQAGFKASTNTPPALERGALAKVGSSISFDGINSVGAKNSLPDAGTFSRVRESASQSQKAETHLDNASKTAARAYTEAIGKGIINSKTSSLAEQMTDMVGFDRSRMEAFQTAQQSMQQNISTFQMAEKLISKGSLSESETRELSNAVGFDVSGELKKGNFLGVAAKAQEVGLQGIAQTILNGVDRGLDITKVNQTLGSTGNSWQTTSMTAETARAVATSALIATTTKATKESETLTQSDDKTRTLNATLASARSEMQNYSQADKASSEFKVSSEQLANIDNATNGLLSSRVNAAFEEIVAKDKDVAAAYAANTVEFSNVSGSDKANFLRQADALNHGNGDARKALNTALLTVGNMLGHNINGDHIADVNKGAYGVRGEVNKGVADVRNMRVDVPTASQIRAEANNIKGRVDGEQSRIEAAANQQPTPQGGGTDYYNQVDGQGNAAMGELKAAHVQNNASGHFPLKMPNGDQGRVVLGDGMGSIFLTKDSLANKYVIDESDRIKRAIVSNTATPSEVEWYNKNAPKNANGTFPTMNVVSATGALIGGIISGDKNIGRLETINSKGQITSTELGSHQLGKMLYEQKQQNAGNPNAKSGSNTLYNPPQNNIQLASQGQEAQKQAAREAMSKLGK